MLESIILWSGAIVLGALALRTIIDTIALIITFVKGILDAWRYK